MGWSRGALTGEAAVDCGTLCDKATLHLQQLADGEVGSFSEWVRLRRPATHPFDATWLNGDLEWLNELTSRIRGRS